MKVGNIKEEENVSNKFARFLHPFKYIIVIRLFFYYYCTNQLVVNFLLLNHIYSSIKKVPDL